MISVVGVWYFQDPRFMTLMAAVSITLGLAGALFLRAMVRTIVRWLTEPVDEEKLWD